MWKIIQITFFIYLVILAVLDIRTRKLPVWLLAAGGICVILSQLIRRETPWELCLFGAAAGCIFLMISKMTQESFGYGDSLLILLLGVAVGYWNLISLLAIAFFCQQWFLLRHWYLENFIEKRQFHLYHFWGSDIF